VRLKNYNAKLIFFDNVYPLGKVVGPMTGASPYNPHVVKKVVRARVGNSINGEAGKIAAYYLKSRNFIG